MKKINKWIKQALKSRTLWFNAVIAVLATAEASSGMLKQVIPGDIYAYLTFALATGNAFLRTITTKPLSEK